MQCLFASQQEPGFLESETQAKENPGSEQACQGSHEKPMNDMPFQITLNKADKDKIIC